jgi:hypothetical protein
MNYNSIGTKPAKSNDIFKALIFIAIVIALSVLFMPAKAQTVPKVSDKVLKDTTINGKVFKLYVGSRGGKYTLVTSKSGNVYKKYFKAK